MLENENIVILKQGDRAPTSGIEVGDVSAGDKGLSINCSYDEVMKILKEDARKSGANILKITQHILPSEHGSSCDRIKAKLYRVENAELFEKEIEWTASRKLKWSDFKRRVPANSPQIENTSATTYCNISFKTNWVSIVTKMKTFVTATFICDSSWVKTEGLKRNELLLHEQLHFDIAEVYAREIRQGFAEKKFSFANSLQEASNIYSRVYQLYYRRQRRFDDETNHGVNAENEKKWEETVAKELAESSAFAK